MVQKSWPVIPGGTMLGDGLHLPKNGMHNLCMMKVTVMGHMNMNVE